MKSTILGLVALGLLAGSSAVNAGITFTDDSTSELRGYFSFTGAPSGESVSPISFGFLPDGSNDQYLRGGIGYTAATGQYVHRLFTAGVGTPNNPFFEAFTYGGSASWGDLSGYYTNGYSYTGSVYWRYFDLAVAGGTFSGNFCFSKSEAGCQSSSVPEPGTLALLGLGLAGLGFTRRRKAN